MAHLALQELRGFYPDLETLLALPPEELGAKMLYILRVRAEAGNRQTAGFHTPGIVVELGRPHPDFEAYVKGKGDQAVHAVAEAWAWLEGQGLLVPTPGENGHNGWRILSRRARDFEDPSATPRLAGTRLLNRDALEKVKSRAI